MKRVVRRGGAVARAVGRPGGARDRARVGRAPVAHGGAARPGTHLARRAAVVASAAVKRVVGRVGAIARTVGRPARASAARGRAARRRTALPGGATVVARAAVEVVVREVDAHRPAGRQAPEARQPRVHHAHVWRPGVEGHLTHARHADRSAEARAIAPAAVHVARPDVHARRTAEHLARRADRPCVHREVHVRHARFGHRPTRAHHADRARRAGSVAVAAVRVVEQRIDARPTEKKPRGTLRSCVHPVRRGHHHPVRRGHHHPVRRGHHHPVREHHHPVREHHHPVGWRVHRRVARVARSRRHVHRNAQIVGRVGHGLVVGDDAGLPRITAEDVGPGGLTTTGEHDHHGEKRTAEQMARRKHGDGDSINN